MKPAPRHCTLWSPTHHCHSFIPITFLPSYRHHRHCTLELPTCHPFMPAIIAIVFFSQLTPSMTPRSQDQLLSHLDPLPGYLVQATTLVRQIFALHNHWTYYLETLQEKLLFQESSAASANTHSASISSTVGKFEECADYLWISLPHGVGMKNMWSVIQILDLLLRCNARLFQM